MSERAFSRRRGRNGLSLRRQYRKGRRLSCTSHAAHSNGYPPLRNSACTRPDRRSRRAAAGATRTSIRGWSAGPTSPPSWSRRWGESGRRDFRRLVALLEQPLAAAGVGPDKRPVYHLVIAARKDAETGEMVDRHLADGEWRDIAATYLVSTVT
jgi:hypothetical protein